MADSKSKIALRTLLPLLLACRAASDPRLYPTIWRTRLLLSSRVWDPANDTRAWPIAKTAKHLAAFAMLWRRYATSPYLVLDIRVHPAHRDPARFAEILHWGYQRAQTIAAGVPLTLYVDGLPPAANGDWPPALAELGFTPTTPDPTAQDVYYSLALPPTLDTPALPPGYHLRPLASLEELAAYQAMSGFAAVNPHHQAELFASAEYSHQVIIDPAGQFAAYCECSIFRAEWDVTGQKIGWIDYIETIPEQRGRGLGRAALLAGLAQLQTWGAETAMLITTSNNLEATRLYERTGFQALALPIPPTFQAQV